MDPITISGQILSEGRFIDGHAIIENGFVVEIDEGLSPDADIEGIVLPPFVNSHTHIGDSIVKPGDIEGLSLEEIVEPPNGVKHLILERSSDDSVSLAMERTIDSMTLSGTTEFFDFREGGIAGSALLRGSIQRVSTGGKIFGRPSRMEYIEEEMDTLLDIVDGIGISAISDWPADALENVADHAKKRGKPIAMHASEIRREDMETILSYDPLFLVHMCRASDNDIRMCADSGVPVVVCPRSNNRFGLRPPVEKMLSAGISVSLGTDNAMFFEPDMFDEMRFLAGNFDIPNEEIVNIGLFNIRKSLNPKSIVRVEKGVKADLMVLTGTTSSVVRADKSAIRLLISDGNTLIRRAG